MKYKDLSKARKEKIRSYNKKWTEKSYANYIRVLYICNKTKFKDVTLEFLLDLYNKQNGKCALSGLQMSNKLGDLYSISIDRINSKIGYDMSNVQLTCQFINLGKNKHTNEDVFEFFELLKNSN
jgi:hypothetical protein